MKSIDNRVKLVSHIKVARRRDSTEKLNRIKNGASPLAAVLVSA